MALLSRLLLYASIEFQMFLWLLSFSWHPRMFTSRLQLLLRSKWRRCGRSRNHFPSCVFTQLVSGTQPMANRACFRMPKTKDAIRIPDNAITINDLRRHICKIYNIPCLSLFFLHAWTNRGSKKKTVVLKDDQYIVDLEDNHGGTSPLMITLCWGFRNERRKRQQPELEDRQDRTRKQARLDKHVCAICNRAECDGMSCDVMSCVGQYAQNEAAMTAESNSLKAEIEEYKHKCEGCDCKREGCDYFLQSSCWA